jgi:phospholipid/cholesterol/gamma-HCH transport system substrate-binding protein
METKASHVLIGAFTLAVLVLAVVFALWLGKLSLDREWDEYDIVFTEAVTGLSVGGAVQYNGIQVGEVRRLSLAPDNPSEVMARVRVNGGTPIKIDTQAKLTFTGLTGVAIIQLTGGTSNAALLREQAANGEVPRLIAQESALQKLMSSSEDIVTSVNDMLLRVSVLLNEENLGKVAATLDHIEKISGSIAEKSDGLGQAVADLSAASRVLKNTLAQTDRLVARIEQATASTQQLLDHEAKELLVSARSSLDAAKRFADSAYATIEQNRDAVASFSNQGLAQVGPALAELRATLRNLQKLTDRLSDDPANFLLGRDEPKEYDPR